MKIKSAGLRDSSCFIALQWIEKSIEVIDPNVIYINVETEWRDLLEEPRFTECLEKAGIGKRVMENMF